VNSTPLTAAFVRPSLFHIVLLGIAGFFAYNTANNLSIYRKGKPFSANAACLHVLARRGGPAAGLGNGSAVAAFGLLRGGCPVVAPANKSSAGDGDDRLCITYADGAVSADGYYFTTLGPDSSPALDPVMPQSSLRSCVHKT
jgi:hypothetical protein